MPMNVDNEMSLWYNYEYCILRIAQLQAWRRFQQLLMCALCNLSADRKRGRKAAISFEDKVAILKSFASKFQQLEDSGLQLGTTNNIWNELHESCDGMLTAKGWYTFVKGKQSELYKLIGVNRRFSTVRAEDESARSTDNDVSDDDFVLDRGIGTNTFTVALTRFEWDTIKPENTTYTSASGAQRTRLRLKKGAWTGMLANKLHAVAAKPCVWIFDNSQASSSAVKIDGHCKHCSSTFTMNLTTIPEVENGDPNEYIANFTTTFCIKNEHCTGKEKNKRQLRGAERAEMAARLKKTTVSAARQHIIEQTMTVRDTEPPVLYSASVLCYT
jgi:hypothetical protein